MFFETRLSRSLTEILCNLKEKMFTVQKAFALILLSLFTGFLFGNLFGTLLDALRLYFIWNGFVGLFLLLFIEAVNSLVYGISFSKKYESGNKEKNNFLKVPSRLIESQLRKPGEQLDKIGDVSSYDELARPYVTKQPREAFLKSETSVTKSEKQSSSSIDVSMTLQSNVKKRRKLNIPEKRTLLFHQTVRHNVIHLERTVNSFKIGLLFGFFVDSFKVGS